MGSDDEGTHRRIGRALARVSRLIQQANGEIFSFSGDGLMSTLPTSAAALRCAIRIQTAFEKENARLDPDKRVVFRIGLNAGNILLQDGRVAGDVVNIAARLQELAEPGGICVTAAIVEQAGRPRSTSLLNIGEQMLKNIRQPVLVYRVRLSNSAVHPCDEPDARTPQVLATVRDPRPSVAVFPFRVLGEEDNNYFGEGIVEDVITSLSGLRELVVISRSSTMAFARQDLDVRTAGQQLGVRYLVTGSVRRSPEAIRVSVELSDAASHIALWADANTTPLEKLFDVQDTIVRRIVSGIAPHIQEEELHRALRMHPQNMTAYDLTLQALHQMELLVPTSFQRAHELLAKAMHSDPHFAMPVTWAVWWYVIWIGQGWSTQVEEDTSKAVALAEQAVALDPQDALALAMRGHLHSFLLHDYEAGLAYLERAVQAGPSHAIAVMLYALTLAYLDRGEEAVKYAEYGQRLSPFDRRRYLYDNVLAWAHYANGAFEKAVRWARLSATAAPAFTANLRVLIASLIAAGRLAEARAAAAQMLALESDFSMSRYLRTRQPFAPGSIRDRFVSSLTEVGLPP
jgi:adenylate cyclase